jgi:type IV secretory pathway VirB10-like protein
LRRPSLRSQLNQIRLWVRQGRTDAWIAHKLDISTEQLGQFKRDHALDADAAPPPQPVSVATPPVDELEEEEDEDDEELDEPDEEAAEEEDEQTESGRPAARRRRRGRRGGRRRSGRAAASYEGTFDHGEEGYGLWLDPAVADSEIYTEHWAGHREVAITVEPDAITIRRAESEPGD